MKPAERTTLYNMIQDIRDYEQERILERNNPFVGDRARRISVPYKTLSMDSKALNEAKEKLDNVIIEARVAAFRKDRQRRTDPAKVTNALHKITTLMAHGPT